MALSFIMEIIEFIFNKGFSKEIKLKKRLPWIISYYLILFPLTLLFIYLSIKLIILKKIIGYFILFMGILLCILLFAPFFKE